MKTIVTVAILMLLTGRLFAGASDAAFQRMLSLSGVWEGKLEGGETVKISYEPISGKTALMETMKFQDGSSMSTIYHTDGDRLMATHYCAGSNQPRLVSSTPAAEGNQFEFHFLDGTNLTGHPHVSDISLKLTDENHLHQKVMFKGEKETHVDVEYTRVAVGQ